MYSVLASVDVLLERLTYKSHSASQKSQEELKKSFLFYQITEVFIND